MPLWHAANASVLGPPGPVRRIRQQHHQGGSPKPSLLHSTSVRRQQAFTELAGSPRLDPGAEVSPHSKP